MPCRTFSQIGYTPLPFKSDNFLPIRIEQLPDINYKDLQYDRMCFIYVYTHQKPDMIIL